MKSFLCVAIFALCCVSQVNAERPIIVCENGICRILPRVLAVEVKAVEWPTPAPVEAKPIEVASEPQVMHSVLVREVQPVRNIASHCSEHKPARGILKRIFGRR